MDIRKTFVVLLAVGVFAAGSGEVLAQPAVTITVEDTTGPEFINPTGTAIGGGLFEYQGQHVDPDWTLDWGFQVNPDPHYTTLDGLDHHFQGTGTPFFVFQSATGVGTRDYTLRWSMPVSPKTAPLWRVYGDLPWEIVFPKAADMVEPIPSIPAFDGQFDGQSVFDLFFQQPLDQANPVQYMNKPDIINNFGPANTMEIEFNFRMTEDTTVQVHAGFFAIPIPEPSAFLLGFFAIAGLGLLVGRPRGNRSRCDNS